MIYVCDSLMGSGKTSAAIQQMNEDTSRPYLFITPYLSEVERITAACPERRFVSPQHRGKGKLDSLESLLRARRNIASTHALFKKYTAETAELIREGNYVLIMDELCDVVDTEPVHRKDRNLTFHGGVLELDSDMETVKLIDKDYDGVLMQKLVERAKLGNLIYFGNSLLIWFYPESVLRAFSDIYILTYGYEQSYQGYYLQYLGMETTPIGVEYRDNGYHFCDTPTDYSLGAFLAASKIHILDNPRSNDIGEGRYDLSRAWYQRENLERLKRALLSVRGYRFNVKTGDFMWTSFASYKSALSGAGGKSGFVACNTRGINHFGDRHYLGYLINRFMNPFLKRFFASRGIEVDEDNFALYEMLQWIFRSAIRNGEDIYIYVPSARMRWLLRRWCEGMTNRVSSDELLVFQTPSELDAPSSTVRGFVYCDRRLLSVVDLMGEYDYMKLWEPSTYFLSVDGGESEPFVAVEDMVSVYIRSDKKCSFNITRWGVQQKWVKEELECTTTN